MADYIVQPQDISSTTIPLANNYKSNVSDASTLSFGQKTNTHSEAPQPMIGFKFNSDAEHGVTSLVSQPQATQTNQTGYKLVKTEVLVQKFVQASPSSTKLRPSSVTPTKRFNREPSTATSSRPSSALRGRPLHNREVSTTNILGMTDYINKRSQERSVELKVKTLGENKKVQAKTKASGKVVLDTTNQRRHLERQVAAMENRIKRLQTEDTNIAKKIEAEDAKTEQALANKMRHCEEIATKELRNKKRAESVQKRKEENLRHREELKTSVRKAMIGKMKDNYEQAQTLKRTNEDKMDVNIENRRKAAEEKRASNKALNESINANKSTRAALDESNRKETSSRYVDKANIERERARELSLKCKELEKMESEMLAKLSTTKGMLSAKKTHFTKVSAAKGVIAVNQSVTEEN